jgi:hypothetical protein
MHIYVPHIVYDISRTGKGGTFGTWFLDNRLSSADFLIILYVQSLNLEYFKF